MGKIRKSHFWNGSNYIKVILVIIVLFVLSVNLMVNYLYRKYGLQIHIFPPKMGLEVQTTLSVKLKMWKIHYYHFLSILRIQIRISVALYCNRFGNDEYSTNLKHLLRFWPFLARSSILHFAGAVNTRQKITMHIINLVYSEFPNRSCRSVRSFISTLNYT